MGMTIFTITATVVAILLSVTSTSIALADWRTRRRHARAAESGNALSAAAAGVATLPAVHGTRTKATSWRMPRRAKLLAVLALGLFVVTVAAAYFVGWRPGRVTEKDSMVVADFVNQTKDPLFNDSLKQALKVDLQQSPYLNILSDSRVVHTLGLMGRAAGEPLTANVAREVCLRSNSKAMISGSIANLGEQYVIGLNVTNCANGDALASEQARARGKENVLDALDSAVTRLRGRLGESLASVKSHGAPIALVTTSSLPALQAYSLGLRLESAQGSAAAIPHFEEAIRLDPNFAMAYVALGSMQADLGHEEAAAQNMRKAFELRNRVSERERPRVESSYYDTMLWNLDKAIPVYKEWIETYPRDPAPHSSLGIIYDIEGQYDVALQEAQQALALNPDEGGYYTNLANVQISLGELSDAESTLQKMRSHGLKVEQAAISEYQLAFLQGKRDPFSTLPEAGSADFETALLLQATTASYYGRRKTARELLARVSENDLSHGDKDGAAAAVALGAVFEALVEDDEQARKEALRALDLSSFKDVQVLGSFALALSGDGANAQAAFVGLRQKWAEDSVVNYYWYPAVQAATAMRRSDPQAALKILQSARYDFGQVTPPMFVGSACPPYLRGLVFLMLGQADAAANEFKTVLGRQSVTVNFPTGALAQLGLARALLASHDVAGAKAAYEKFFLLWKDADADIPLLQKARAEYAGI